MTTSRRRAARGSCTPRRNRLCGRTTMQPAAAPAHSLQLYSPAARSPQPRPPPRPPSRVHSTSGPSLVLRGHGQDDYQTGLKYGLPLLSPVDDGGRFTEEAGERFVGMNVLGDGNREVRAFARPLHRRVALSLRLAVTPPLRARCASPAHHAVKSARCHCTHPRCRDPRLSLITHHPSIITHHSSLITHLDPRLSLWRALSLWREVGRCAARVARLLSVTQQPRRR